MFNSVENHEKLLQGFDLSPSGGNGSQNRAVPVTRIRTQGLGKAYPIYKRPIDSLKELLFRKNCHETVWAVRDVELAVPAGSAVGIVGDNGAGKTTLLKLLAGGLEPSSGRVERVGRVSSILELGTGFHMDLTGYENIRIGCAVLGLSPAQTAERLPAIVNFSELAHVLDRPVKTYSSGMFLRLAFSVATTVDPDILVVDEHLSVGDQHFRKKCLDRISRLLADQAALVFCSHEFYAIREVCAQCLWLRDGRPAMFGPTADVLDAYQDYIRAREAATTGTAAPEASQEDRIYGGDTCLLDVALGGDCHDGVIDSGGNLVVTVRARLSADARRDGVHIGILVLRNDLEWCYGVSSKMDGIADAWTALGGDEYGIRMTFDQLPLLGGQYSLRVALLDKVSPHLYDVTAANAEFKVRQSGGEVGMARLPHHWESYA